MPCDACSGHEPQVPNWEKLLGLFNDGTLDTPTYLDAFFDTWRYAHDHGFRVPAAIEKHCLALDALAPQRELLHASAATEIELERAVALALNGLTAAHAGDLRP